MNMTTVRKLVLIFLSPNVPVVTENSVCENVLKIQKMKCFCYPILKLVDGSVVIEICSFQCAFPILFQINLNFKIVFFLLLLKDLKLKL